MRFLTLAEELDMDRFLGAAVSVGDLLRISGLIGYCQMTSGFLEAAEKLLQDFKSAEDLLRNAGLSLAGLRRHVWPGEPGSERCFTGLENTANKGF